MFKKTVLPIFLATLWIGISEFVRNSFWLHTLWSEHYQNMGLIFPEKPINGAIWGLWSLCFAIVIFILRGKFSLIQTTLLSWFIGFVLMWLVIGNMGVLPFGILPLAIPLSLIETFGAVYLISRFLDKK
ncbi:MAG: hypothetical protein C4K58_06635 [Flavobacteriaceae bacterium]|nr:MAG: hypothetical protein C4K58_06635 [Flavobacteriaceae bacterium]